MPPTPACGDPVSAPQRELFFVSNAPTSLLQSVITRWSPDARAPLYEVVTTLFGVPQDAARDVVAAVARLGETHGALAAGATPAYAAVLRNVALSVAVRVAEALTAHHGHAGRAAAAEAGAAEAGAAAAAAAAALAATPEDAASIGALFKRRELAFEVAGMQVERLRCLAAGAGVDRGHGRGGGGGAPERAAALPAIAATLLQPVDAALLAASAATSGRLAAGAAERDASIARARAGAAVVDAAVDALKARREALLKEVDGERADTRVCACVCL